MMIDSKKSGGDKLTDVERYREKIILLKKHIDILSSENAGLTGISAKGTELIKNEIDTILNQ